MALSGACVVELKSSLASCLVHEASWRLRRWEMDENSMRQSLKWPQTSVQRHGTEWTVHPLSKVNFTHHLAPIPSLSVLATSVLLAQEHVDGASQPMHTTPCNLLRTLFVFRSLTLSVLFQQDFIHLTLI
jgi:hypothetical protein